MRKMQDNKEKEIFQIRFVEMGKTKTKKHCLVYLSAYISLYRVAKLLRSIPLKSLKYMVTQCRN